MLTQKSSKTEICQAIAFQLLVVVFGLGAFAGRVNGEGSVSSVEQGGGPAYVEAFQGKLVCPLKRPVLMHFKGTVGKLRVHEGMRVRKGEVLAEYRLSSEMVPGLKKRIAGVLIKDLENELANFDKNLASLQRRKKDLGLLTAQGLAPAEGLRQLEKEIEIAEAQGANLVKKLRLEREVFREDLDLLREYMGGTLRAVESGEPVGIVAPIAGQVIWIAPEMREGAELPPGTQVFTIGVMEPMLMRAQVHELEAVKISVGDLADVTFDSFPNRVFEARVTRVSWAPLTPAVEQPTYYSLELSVANPDQDLREGLKGQVTLRKQIGR